jgi:processive 1,2-diacylglycerol beta-glucosyltransferase
LKLLILTSSFGGGHTSVAKALKRSLEENFSMISEIVDPYDLLNPKINRWNSKFYVYMMKYFPKVYGLFYESTYDLDKDNPVIDLLSLPAIGVVERLLKEENWDGVVSVYPTYAGMIRILKGRGIKVPKSFVVITDFVAHAQWLHDHMDSYFVPSYEVKYDLYRKGVNCPRVEVTGIPINPEFDKFREDRRSSVVISAGLFGMTPAVKEICSVAERVVPPGIDIFLLCGKDSKLCNALRGNVRRIELIDRVLSHREMAEFLGRAIVLISKAGGIITSEALASETPMIVYKPLPGQEYYNTLYLLKNEAGLMAKNTKELERVLGLFFKERDLRDRLVQNIRRIRKPNSSYEVAKGIYDVLRRGD